MTAAVRLWSSGTRSADTPRWSSRGAARSSCGGLVLAGASTSTCGWWTTPYRWAVGLVPRIPADRLTRWNDWLLRRLYSPDVVDATIRSGYAFHTLPAAWGEVLGRFDAEAMRHVAAPVLILNGEKTRSSGPARGTSSERIRMPASN